MQRVLEHYEHQTDEEATAEDKTDVAGGTHALVEVPVELVPAIRDLIAAHRKA